MLMRTIFKYKRLSAVFAIVPGKPLAVLAADREFRHRLVGRCAQGAAVADIEAGAVQRETWKNTEAGWKLYRVDDIHDDGLLVDDQPYPPN